MPQENEDIIINGNVATWSMRMEGNLTGTYVGTFKFRCYLTPMQSIEAGREQRDLLGANMILATEHEQFLAYALTQLKQRIISAPPFWASANAVSMTQGDLPDENIVQAVLDAAIRAELKYKEQRKKKKDDSIAIADKALSVLTAERQKELEEVSQENKE